MRYYFTYTKSAKIEKSDNRNSCQGYGALELLEIIGRDVKFTSTLINSFAVLLNMHLIYNLTIPLLGIFPSAMTTNIYIYVQGLYMFIAALVIVANNWKPLKSMS